MGVNMCGGRVGEGCCVVILFWEGGRGRYGEVYC